MEHHVLTVYTCSECDRPYLIGEDKCCSGYADVYTYTRSERVSKGVAGDFKGTRGDTRKLNSVKDILRNADSEMEADDLLLVLENALMAAV